MKKFLCTTLPLAGLCLLTACGEALDPKRSPTASSSPVDNSEVTQNEVIVSDGSNINGFYAADLYPINVNLHFKTVGMAGVEREGDQFSASVRLKYGPHGEVVHKQAIYTGRRCPNINDDLNKDAYIDMKEALVALGHISIPLDGNLASQEAGLSQYPSGHAETGKYFYQQSTSFSTMFSDLKADDTNSTDHMIKLSPDEGLTFPGRVVLIQGTNKKKELPETVGTVEGESAYHSLPIACGVLWKVKSRPTELTPDAE